MNRAAAFHQEFPHRGADPGNDGGLLAGKQNRLRADGVLNRRLFDGSDLHRDRWFAGGFVGGAAHREKQAPQDRQHKHAAEPDTALAIRGVGVMRCESFSCG